MAKRKKRSSLVKRGVRRRSTLEDFVEDQLIDINVDYKYENTKFTYTLPVKQQKYTPDFHLGGNIYLECKGAGPFYGLTPEVKHKMLQVKTEWPHIKFIFVFDKPLEKTEKGFYGKKTIAYAQWAEQNGFSWYDKNDIRTLIQDITNYD